MAPPAGAVAGVAREAQFSGKSGLLSSLWLSSVGIQGLARWGEHMLSEHEGSFIRQHHIESGAGLHMPKAPAPGGGREIMRACWPVHRKQGASALAHQGTLSLGNK